MHQSQSIFSVHRLRNHSQAAEVIQQIVFDMCQPWFRLPHGIRFNAESEIFRFCQSIIALCQLLFQHLTVLGTDRIEIVFSEWNADTLFKTLRIGTHIHKRQFKTDRAVEKVQESTPFIKNSCFILLLCQLIIDVLVLNGFRIIVVCHTADTVREHPLKWNGILCSLRNSLVPLCLFNHRFNFFLLFSGQIRRHFYFSCLFFLFEEQSALPPSQVDSDA